MVRQIYPCLWFDTQAREAADFYCSLFDNSKLIFDKKMFVKWEINGMVFTGLNAGPHYQINPSISIFVKYTSKEEVTKLWNSLIEEGQAMMALNKYDWSELYGWVKDKYGLTWQIMLADSESIAPAFLFTSTQFGNAESAMGFYQKIFENSAIIIHQKYPNTTPFEGKTLYAEFNLNGYNIIAMDGPGNHNYSFNEAFSFMIECDTQEEIDYYWDSLIAEGGTEGQCGWCKDKYGVSWQVIPSVLGNLINDPEKGPKIIQAFSKMKKFDIQTLLDV